MDYCVVLYINANAIDEYTPIILFVAHLNLHKLRMILFFFVENCVYTKNTIHLLVLLSIYFLFEYAIFFCRKMRRNSMMYEKKKKESLSVNFAMLKC